MPPTPNRSSSSRWSQTKQHLNCTVSPVSPFDDPDVALLLEFRHIDQQLAIAREERLNEQQQANRELIRSLAHEIKNPLGGIRGAAQLLERELDRPQLIESRRYHWRGRPPAIARQPAVTPHRPPTYRRINIHELLVRVNGSCRRSSRASRSSPISTSRCPRSRRTPSS